MVESSLVDQIIRALPPNEVYERLVLVVGQPSNDRTEALETLAKQKSIPLIHVGPALSECLLEIPATHRPQKVLDCMRQILGKGSAPCILDRIELLFAPELSQNPLLLLQQLSRERTLVVAWSGRIREGRLEYAEPQHPEYRQYPARGLTIVTSDTSHLEMEEER